jgi:ribosomal protein S18 acetylase RimI-like enzyme
MHGSTSPLKNACPEQPVQYCHSAEYNKRVRITHAKEPSPMRIAVRPATTADAAPVAGLVSALGYPTSSAQMHKRLESVMADKDYSTLVACDGQHLVGFIGTRVGPLYELDGRYGQIMALAVATDRQRRGIGRMLMQAAESMLLARDVSVLVVTSGNQRADAHAFYEKNGYTWTGRRYKKTVGFSLAG